MKHTLYLAGGLFNVAERAHNIRLAKALDDLKFKTILPQNRTKEYMREDGTLNLLEMVQDCELNCKKPDNIFIGNLDGPEADSGTSVEFGIARAFGLLTILYRTDFRTSPEHEVGVNGMFQLADKIIYMPALFTHDDDLNNFYVSLATEIKKEIVRRKRF